MLHAMGRGYSAADYLRLVDRVRSIWPDVSFTTDVIVGFPGESDESFQNTCDLVARVGFSRLHVFEFSARPGAPAASFSHQVPEKIKGERSHALARLGEQLASRRAAEQIESIVEVLFEERENGSWTGYTRGYFRAAWETEEALGGELRQVRVVGANAALLQLRG